MSAFLHQFLYATRPCTCRAATLATLLFRRNLTPAKGLQGVGRSVGHSRTLTSSAARASPPGRKTRPPPLTPDQLVIEFKAVYREAKVRGLRVRPDGYVAVGDVINKSKILSPITFEEAGELVYEPRIAIGQFINAAGKDDTLSLLHEPQLHCLGDPSARLIWWVRNKKQAAVPRLVDQATYRILPGSKVRNAIYKAKLDEWEHIRVHGLRPPPDEEMVVMASIDKIDEEDKNTSFVYVFIDMEEAMNGGVEFFYTRHFQVVSPGDDRGVIPPRFFKDAVKVVTTTKTLVPVVDNCSPSRQKSSGTQQYTSPE